MEQNFEAEASLLGAILIDGEAMIKIADLLEPSDFSDKRHELIYNAIKKLYDATKSIDIVTVANQLTADKCLDLAGGPAYLSGLSSGVPSVAHIEQYAEIVSEKSERRALLKAAQDIALLANDGTKSLQELLDEAEGAIFGAHQHTSKVLHIEDVLAASLSRLDNKEGHGIATGFKSIDNITSGLHASDLFILAARPSMGKSTMALNIAHHVAKQGSAVLIFSLEMSKEQLADRLLALESGVDAWNIRTGNLNDSSLLSLNEAMGRLSEFPIYLDDTAGLTISDLRSIARREQLKHPAKLIIVDYLQLVSGGAAAANGRVQEVSEVSRGLKALARELHVPVLALSQLSRLVESRSPQIPQLSDLRDTGALEQDADVVAFLYREDYYNPETDRKNITDFLIKKHRNGPIGNTELYFDRNRQRFSDVDKWYAR